MVIASQPVQEVSIDIGIHPSVRQLKYHSRMPRLPYSRVLVYGVTGSGKTTLARKIGEKTGIEWHSVDDLTWDPGWQQVPVDEQRRRMQAICDGDRWILDTAYGTWRDIPLARVELIVALDYPRWLSFKRLLARSIMRAIDKRPICNGNMESFRLMFSKESILFWHFKSFKSKKTRIRDWAQKTDGPKVLRFTRPRDVEAWLNSLTEPALDTDHAGV